MEEMYGEYCMLDPSERSYRTSPRLSYASFPIAVRT